MTCRSVGRGRAGRARRAPRGVSPGRTTTCVVPGGGPGPRPARAAAARTAGRDRRCPWRGRRGRRRRPSSARPSATRPARGQREAADAAPPGRGVPRHASATPAMACSQAQPDGQDQGGQAEPDQRRLGPGWPAAWPRRADQHRGRPPQGRGEADRHGQAARPAGRQAYSIPESFLAFASVCVTQRLFDDGRQGVSPQPRRRVRGRVGACAGRRSCSPTSTTSRDRRRAVRRASARPSSPTAAVRSTSPVTLASRLHGGSVDLDVTLELLGVGAVSGRLTRVATGWCLLRGAGPGLGGPARRRRCRARRARTAPSPSWPGPPSPGSAWAPPCAASPTTPSRARCTSPTAAATTARSSGSVPTSSRSPPGEAGRVVVVGFAHLAAVQSRR